MELSAQAAVIAELTAENAAMRALITDMYAAEAPHVQTLIDAGHTPSVQMFPFTERMRAFVPPVANSGVRKFVAP